MAQRFVPIVLMLLLLLAILSPFSALAGLTLLIVDSLVYGLAIAVFRALIDPAQPD